MAARGRPRAFDREAALLRAMELFWAKGYDGTSLSDLTAAMGINSPSLYAAFGSKEALFREALDLYGKVEGPDVWNAVANAATAKEAIAGFLRASAITFSRPDKPRGCLIVLSGLQAGDTSKSVCDALKEHRADNIAWLRQPLERAVADGELPQDVDCTAVATFYATIQQGMSIQARDGASRETLLTIGEGAMAGWDALIEAARRR
jgi:AcrR family transcriptional regulator